MKKSRGIITLIVTAALIIGLGFVAVYGVDSAHHGSARNIKRGLDLAGGVSITYQVKGDEEPSAEDMSDTVYKLQKRVEQQNYSTESQVYQEGSNRINVEIPGESNAEEVLANLGQPGSLLFIMEYDDEGNANYTQGLAVAEDGNYEFVYMLARSMEEIEASGSIVITGTDVKSAEDAYSAYYRLESMEYYANILMLTEKVIGKQNRLTRQQVESLLAMREKFGISRGGIPHITDEVEK